MAKRLNIRTLSNLIMEATSIDNLREFGYSAISAERDTARGTQRILCDDGAEFLITIEEVMI